MNMNIEKEDEYERALIFLNNKIVVHVSRRNGLWHNGMILEVSKDFFILKDRVDGKEYDVLFQELKSPIERYRGDKE